MVQHRFLLKTYPIQGHINPGIQFAKRLAAMGVHVTFATSVYLHRLMLNKPTIPGLSFDTFSDGYDFASYISELKSRGSESLRNIITASKHEGHPFTCLAYTAMLPWVAKVALEFHIPGLLLWIQPATVFYFSYYYFHEYGDCFHKSTIQLPGLPFSLTTRDIPSFFLPFDIYSFALPSLQEHFQDLDAEINPTVLVNTFQDLEPEALRALNKLTMIPTGPLIPSAFLDGNDPDDTSFGGDILDVSNDCVQWLD